MTLPDTLDKFADASIERQVRCEISPEMELEAIIDMFYGCEDQTELKALGVRLALDKIIPQAIKDQARPDYVRRWKELQ
jgi:hypothetical protein